MENKMTKAYVKNMVLCSFGAVLMCICSWIMVPFIPVPFTMQSFGVFFAVLVLGEKRGTLSVLLYILLGLVGVPVFSGFGSGLGALSGYSGGFIIGFLVECVICLIAVRLAGDSEKVRLTALGTGQLCCYSLGWLWFVCLSRLSGSGAGWLGALSVTVLPFVIPDGIKLFLALLLSRRLKKYVKL